MGGASFYSKAKPREGLINVISQIGHSNSIFPNGQHEGKTEQLSLRWTTWKMEIIEVL